MHYERRIIHILFTEAIRFFKNLLLYLKRWILHKISCRFFPRVLGCVYIINHIITFLTQLSFGDLGMQHQQFIILRCKDAKCITHVASNASLLGAPTLPGPNSNSRIYLPALRIITIYQYVMIPYLVWVTSKSVFSKNNTWMWMITLYPHNLQLNKVKPSC